MNRFLAVLVLSLFTTPALAGGVLFEPYAGYGVDNSWEQGARSEEYSSVKLGLRLGWVFDAGVLLGIDIDIGAGEITEDPPPTTYTSVEAASGPVVGYEAPFGLRVYTAYLVNTILGVSDTASTFYSGSGYKAGIGYRFHEWVAINVEYKNATHDEFETTTASGDLTQDLTTEQVSVNLSFPFMFE